MIISRMGFDLAGRTEPRLVRGMMLSTAGACADAALWLGVAMTPALLNGDWKRTVLACSLAATGLFLLAVLFRAGALNANFSATYSLVADARLRLADHLARIPLGRVLGHRDGAVADLLTGRFALYQDIMTHVWGLVISGIALPVALWLILAWLDWRLALVHLVFVPVALAAVPWSFRLLDRAAHRIAAARQQAVVGVVEVAGGARDLAFFDPMERRRAAVHGHMEELYRQSMATELAPAPALTVYGLLLNLAVVAVIGTAEVLRQGGDLHPLTMCLAVLLSLRLTAALSELGFFLAELRFAQSALADIRTLAGEPPLPEPGRQEVPASAEVEFDNVTFSHDGRQVIRSVSARLAAGTVTALIGPSGAGKSTLAQLVARLWDVEGGAIRIGGADIRHMTEACLNDTVSMVLQDVVLFEMSVADNIRLGWPDASAEQVEAAARSACIHDRILDLPQGYDTVLDPRSIRLSGGEKQRIAIARALLKDAPLLILDEATASMDLDNEIQVQRALKHLCQGRTVLVIAHRLWTIRNAHHIVVLEDGKVVEQGRHDGLRRQDGLYARMWRMQSGEET